MALQHWTTPIVGVVRRTEHLLLWCDTERAPRKARSDLLDVRLTALIPTLGITVPDGIMVARSTPIDAPDDIEACVASPNILTKRVTLWFARGWLDMVVSGFTSLIDRGVWQWEYLSLDGARVAGRGKMGGRRVDITSLGSWTGGAWDSWRDKLCREGGSPIWRHAQAGGEDQLADASADEVCALSTWHAILDGCKTLQVGAPKLSVGSQARQWWRAWAGPVVTRAGKLVNRARTDQPPKPHWYVGPLPDRPAAAAAAERHAAYGLVREQFKSGHVDGPVAVIDLRSAYLAAMVTAPQPLKYLRKLADTDGATLAESLSGNTGVALVLLNARERVYPFRRGGKVGRARGRYWTWLAGSELSEAAETGDIQEVHTAWIWSAVTFSRKWAAPYMLISESLVLNGKAHIVPFWRALYSARVGGWAQWDRRWVDHDGPAPFGSWATWIHGDPATGELTRWRAIGGRTQYRVDMGDAPGAIPLAYACVTSHVRLTVDTLAAMCPPDDVLAICADSVWIRERAVPELQEQVRARLGSPASIRTDAVYEDAWLDGAGRAVVQIGGKRFPILTGVPTHAEVGSDGISRWIATEPWASGARKRRGNRCSQRQHNFNVGALVRQCSHELRSVIPWHTLADSGLPEELLQPLTPEQRRIDGPQ